MGREVTGILCVALAYAALEANGKQFLGFHGKFHGELIEHFFAVAVYDQTNRFFRINPALFAIEYLILSNFRGGSFMLNRAGWILNFDVWEGMCPTFIAHK